MGVAELGRALGVHANTVRFHLGHLQGNGLVEEVHHPPSRPGRPASLFRAVPQMDPAGPRHYRVLAEILSRGITGSERAGEVATELGRVWGREQTVASPRPTVRSRGGAVRRLVGVLEDFGFAPDPVGTSAATIGLRHCPFLELAKDRPEVVCSAHLGIMRGVVQAWSASLTVEALVPFAEPDLCRVHLGPVGVEP